MQVRNIVFFLGREPKLSAAEIRAVFSDSSSITIKENRLFLATDQDIRPETLITKLGGTIKIAEEISTEGSLNEAIADYLEQSANGNKIHFSLAGDGGKPLALAVKKILKERGVSVRYIEPKNSATILHNDLIKRQSDLTVIGKRLYVTRALQPFEAFGERDFGRPGRDSKSGMLPPKLAQMMINLSGAQKDEIVLDPFCGSGTILSEAVLLGYGCLVGSDLSDKAIADTKKNLLWLGDTYDALSHVKLIQSDIARLPSHLPPRSIDTIITEPYMGKPLTGTESKEHIMSQAHELKLLYKEAFAACAKILKPQGTILFIFPSFEKNGQWVSTVPTADIEKMGFVPISFDADPYLIYMRPKQHLAREIRKFRLR